MRIVDGEVTLLAVPRRVPKSMIAEVGPEWELPIVLVRLRTDDGLEGIGHTITLMPEFSRSLRQMVLELAGLLLGGDPTRPEELSRRMMYAANWVGPGGMLNIAAGALDIAVWDIIGKSAQQPLWRVLGGFRSRVPVYDSGALLAPDLDELQEAAAESVRRGYRAMKMRPGPERFGKVEDVCRRVAAVREAIGQDVDLMYDVNQTWSVSRAIQLGQAFEPYNLTWLEDPTNMEDLRGQRSIRQQIATPICSGEYHYTLASLAKLLEAEAVDHLMVDLLRMGGITPFRKAAGLAAALGVRIASHIIPEVYSHCIAAIPNGLIVEGMPWSEILFENLPDLVDGQLQLSERPGHGLEVRKDVVRRYLVTPPETISV